jgi:hypothetical protein
MSGWKNPEQDDAWLRGHGDGYNGEASDQGDTGQQRQIYDHGKIEGARDYWRDKASGN